MSASFTRSAGTACRGWLLCALLALSGCASMYVDGAVQEVNSSAFKKPGQPRPVQLLFEFQTKGVVNANATSMLKGRVADQVRSSGLFAGVDESPAPDGALLSLTVNNVVLTDDVMSKGFLTGLTLGLAGSQVSDGYICTARYRPGGGAPIMKEARHAIHTTIGASATPTNARKTANADEAVSLMLRDVISNVLNDLSNDPAFAQARP